MGWFSSPFRQALFITCGINASIFDGKTVLNTEYGYLILRYLQDEAKLAGLCNCSRIWAQAGQSQSSLHEHMIGYENKGQSDSRCMTTMHWKWNYWLLLWPVHIQNLIRILSLELNSPSKELMSRWVAVRALGFFCFPDGLVPAVFCTSSSVVFTAGTFSNVLGPGCVPPHRSSSWERDKQV